MSIIFNELTGAFVTIPEGSDNIQYLDDKGEVIDPPSNKTLVQFADKENSIYQLSTGDYIDLSLIASIGTSNEFPESELFQVPVILLHSYEPLFITGPKEVFQELVDAWKRFKGE